MQTSKRAVAKNKLAILYVLKAADIRMSADQLIELVGEFELMDYFDINANLAALVDNSLIDRVATLNGDFYVINDIGRSTLEAFDKDIPFSLKESLDAYMEENRERLRQEGRIYGEYMRVGDGQYRVTLRILNDTMPVFEVSFFVSSREEADTFKRGWKKRAFEVYRRVAEMLMSGE